MNKLVHVCNGILFSSKKKNDLSSQEKILMVAKYILLSESRQTEKNAYGMSNCDPLEKATL